MIVLKIRNRLQIIVNGYLIFIGVRNWQEIMICYHTNLRTHKKKLLNVIRYDLLTFKLFYTQDKIKWYK